MNTKIEEFEDCLILDSKVESRDRGFYILVALAMKDALSVSFLEKDFLHFKFDDADYKSEKISKGTFRNFLARCCVLLQPIAVFNGQSNLYGCSAHFDVAKLDPELSGEMKFEFKNTTKEQWLTFRKFEPAKPR
jgi:hypothetical protein